MGNRRRLNKFISKWIKSDLPEERSTVLLLGVTRIPTSPLPHRRPCSLPASTAPNVNGSGGASRQSHSKKIAPVRRNSSLKKSGGGVGVGISSGGRKIQVPSIDVHRADIIRSQVSVPAEACTENSYRRSSFNSQTVEDTETPKASPVSRCAAVNLTSAPTPNDVMEKSIDSIGTCSLDAEASVDLSDWSEASSADTLRSASVVTPSPEPHLPSYLSLACTVNGYSTTTHYDPLRLASRSRDVSPHRIDTDHQSVQKVSTFSIQNNLLSPPNIVPLPTLKMENALTQHRNEFYSSLKTSTYMSKQSYSSGIFSSITQSKDTTDSCLENGHQTIQNKCVSFESTSMTDTGGQRKCVSETSMKQEYSNGSETKSFIQQRVERLYGPGALAQGFFITKPQKSRLNESDSKTHAPVGDKHSKSMNDNLLEEDDDVEYGMKQSTSSPTLPVLRHLRPEFRAQLPMISPRRGQQLEITTIQKSITVPKLINVVKVNGHSKANEAETISDVKEDVNGTCNDKSVIVEKDGHYFLKILEDQTKRLLELAARVESDMSSPDLSEEVIGKLRSASGKARLLVSQKMQQFKGLCTNNINRTAGEAFPTTNEDLQGFWDMVMLQVDQVDAIFKEIDVLRNNNWKEPAKIEVKNTQNGTAKPKKAVTRIRPSSAANEEARKQREIERKRMIEEKRKAMKTAQQSKPTIEIFVPEASS
ncbi:uncharacterized protein LOC130443505 isoform X1 [Diorhabda sublineata]|uniref:uncharacterized protein LOC130443505 isoform X1 n=2 Tax=Diorhabda sublineata TaxID=1163346 RepID=UPI0024E0A7AE|nr:uncharacterized protein LOC130443505 isoform X1 [Diorhabda sublineata]